MTERHLSAFADFSRFFSSASTASRMNSARFCFPTSASMRSGTSAGSRTRIGVTFIGGRPMRLALADIGKAVKSISNRCIKRYRLLTLYPISFMTSITDRIGETEMAKIKYFNGANELQGVYYDGKQALGYVSKDDLVFVAGKGWAGYVAADRKVEYKSNPSRHECDSRCMNATGLVMKCECACGGKNHGRGYSMMCEAA